jgi:hypothetical protein
MKNIHEVVDGMYVEDPNHPAPKELYVRWKGSSFKVLLSGEVGFLKPSSTYIRDQCHIVEPSRYSEFLLIFHDALVNRRFTILPDTEIRQ